MVSWELTVKFFGISPNVKELINLAKKEGFSNIESLEYKGISEDSCIYRLIVNNRGREQKGFNKFEVIKKR